MKCPHCEYFDGWNSELLKNIEGNKGVFYTLSNKVSMKRDNIDYYSEKETATLYACPKCGKTFIEV